MPECGIGLVPDVGGSFLLARAPGHLGAYLGLTAARMNAGDAIHAGFADLYIQRAKWADLIELLEASGDIAHVLRFAETAPVASLRPHFAEIDQLFATPTLSGVHMALNAAETDFARDTQKALSRNAPLSMACAIETIHRLQTASPTMHTALQLEYRFTWRAMEHGDFLEGVRAAIIDKDRTPHWKFADMNVPQDSIDMMLAPLGPAELTFEDEED